MPIERSVLVVTLLAAALAVALLASASPAAAAGPWAAWKNGPPKGDGYFPIAVWLQDPKNAARFRAAGAPARTRARS